MPNVSSVLANGLSVGLLAGVLSGLFYLVIAGIRWAGKFLDTLWLEVRGHRSSGLQLAARCAQCHSAVTSVTARCVKCDVGGCRDCTWSRSQTWLCPECKNTLREVRQQSEGWFSNQVQRRFNSGAVTSSINILKTSENGTRMDRTTAQVREFIEKLVEKLVCGGLDDVTINRMYDHPDYEPLLEEESPSSTHAKLKQLIECIIREAMALPKMKQAIQRNIENSSTVSDDIDTKTYEDILATAILNKVIEKFQRFHVERNSSIDGNRNLLYELRKEDFIQPNYISSLELGVSDCGSIENVTVGDSGSWHGSAATTEPLSLRIEEHIEEIMTYTDDAKNEPIGDPELDFYFSNMNFLPKHRVPFPELGMDIVDGADFEADENSDSGDEGKLSPQPTDLYNPVDSWEENWLFQKRRLKINPNPQSVPVPMLVPNPNEDLRAQIGDRDADELSDLSECSEGAPADMSDFETSDEEVKSNNISEVKKGFMAQSSEITGSFSELPRSDTPDGGYGGSAEEYASTHDGGSELAEATNSELFKATSVDCLSEFGQQDSEYTEDYASVTQRQMNSLLSLRESDTLKPVPKPRSVLPCTINVLEEKTPDTIEELKSSECGWAESVDNVLATPPRPGTIAEREHKKWESAIPLPNNPYSPENINRRLQKRQFLSRSCSEVSLDTAEAPAIKMTTEPLKVVCASSDLDTKRYERDYYVNVKSAMSPSTSMKSPSAASKTSPLPATENKKQKTEPKQDSDGLRLRDTPTRTIVAASAEKETANGSYSVESEVARLQQQIKQTEERWIKNTQNPKVETRNQKSVVNSTKTVTKDVECVLAASVNNSCENSPQNGLSEKQKDIIITKQLSPEGNNVPKISGKSSVDLKGKCNSEKPQNNLKNCDGVSKSVVNTDQTKFISPRQKNYNSKQPSAVMDRLRTAYHSTNYYEVYSNGNNEKRWDFEHSRSDGSTISSDSEFSPSLPSVKELAKQFSGGAESDSSSTSKGTSPLPNLKGPDVCLATKEVVIVTKKDKEKQKDSSQSKPVRQIHSLTARSMSREFREGLRKNLPVQMDRNLYTFGGSECNLQRSLSPQYSNVSYDSTPGYTSDESDTVSPIPSNRKLKDNIKFWEKMNNSK